MVTEAGAGSEAFLGKGSPEMATNLRDALFRPPSLPSHLQLPAPFLPAFLAHLGPAMRPQATHSRWLQWGHFQWVLKSPR